MRSRIGDTAERSTIARHEAIQTLGYFNDVTVAYENPGIVITVKERPTITEEVDFEGDDQVQSSDLKDVVNFKEYSILNINKVKEDVVAIQKPYEQRILPR